jgi:hypothetical protein
MTNAYLDRATGLWKWGKRGKPKYETKQQCERTELELLTNKLRELTSKVNRGWINHGKGI